MKPSIIISIPSVWSYRNFVVSGICDELEKHYELYYAIPEVAKPTFIENGISATNLLLLKKPKYSSVQTYSYRILKQAFINRNPVNTHEIFKNTSPKISILAIVKNYLLYKLPSIFLFSNYLFLKLEKFENYLYLKTVNGLAANLKTLNPYFLLSTTNVIDSEWPLFRVCQNLKIKTITHILSFDNLTSRGYLPISKFDTYYLWNMAMKAELQKYYNIPASKIKITGTPQFDYHLEQKFLMTQSETHASLGLEIHDKYLLYCANHQTISPTEPILLDAILKAFENDLEIKNYKMVLRLHPMDNYDRWNDLLSKYPEITVSLPWSHQDKNAVYWGNPTASDLMLFSNTLRYASIVFNIASTVSIDAALCNTPIVCVGFNPNNELENKFYNDVHFSEHYKPIMATGASPLATTIDELLVLTKQQLHFPDKFAKERVNLKNYFIPETIHSSSETLVQLLVNA